MFQNLLTTGHLQQTVVHHSQIQEVDYTVYIDTDILLSRDLIQQINIDIYYNMNTDTKHPV